MEYEVTLITLCVVCGKVQESCTLPSIWSRDAKRTTQVQAMKELTTSLLELVMAEITRGAALEVQRRGPTLAKEATA
jgi:hypothetical protein